MKKIALATVAVFAFTTASYVDGRQRSNNVEAGVTRPSPVIPKDNIYTPPATEIVAPEKPVRRGHNVIFGVKPTNDPKPNGLVKTTYVWVIYPQVDDLFAWPDNTKASFGSGVAGEPSRYMLTLVANYLFVDDDGKNPTIVTVQADREITITDGSTPTPDPTPDPVLPAGKYGLAQFTYSAVKDASLQPEDAGKLAASFRGILSRNAGAAFATPAALGQATADSNKLALGNQLTVWQPVLDKIAVKTNDLKIGRSVDEMLLAWDEIAQGLEAYQKAGK